MIVDKFDLPLNNVKMRRRRWDAGCTYDGGFLVSRRFREVCEANELQGAAFLPLPDDASFFSLRSTVIVRFDSEAAQTEFDRLCEACGQHGDVIGTTPLGLVAGEVVPDLGFAQSDLEFASDDEKGPIFFCGDACATVLESAQLRGLRLRQLT